jgi:hypothetical protein
MKYEKEVNQLLINIFRSNWMDDNDWNEFLKEVDFPIEKLSSDLEIGVNNGYSIETQLKLFEKVFRER